jgi:hypothetical protein
LQGVAPLHYSYEDVSRPVVDPIDVCDCTADGPDGYLDLVLHFDVQAILATLPDWASGDMAQQPLTLAEPPHLGLQYIVFLPLMSKTPPPREQYILTLTGNLGEGAPIRGQDCILLLDATEVAEGR